jgi:hypothetical protein
LAANSGVKPSRRIVIPPAAIVVTLLAVAGASLFFYLQYGTPARRDAAPLSAGARAYVKHLRLMDVDMQAHESYLKQPLVQITGKIGNEGDRVLRRVEIHCVFYDPYGQVVLRERVPIVQDKMGNLAPGEIKSFRLPFDNIPESWNQSLPQMVIAHIVFQ